ncbi:unnamed protein product [Bemisia tabaci]|uniref:Mediator of RNA polymerase II transcription subunit 4 n=1 Tax=Bemisia tabaci TaxID=7038 RepID=A0A9P0F589_BEMTA|nr:PREDICTED: mediator of RNA polymerase II transcription subunit 4 [Bemisia tabaci]CAH0392721.1 unnamed protein product [Bemisia tabaci]
MASNLSTRDKLLLLIDDIEAVAKELIEKTDSMKQQKLNGPEHILLTELLVAKDKELKETLKLAEEQAQINNRTELLQAVVDKQDDYIQQLQRLLKEAEQILATALYQAKQKLQSIHRASNRPVASEELIKYAHRISASNAVCAPLTWQPGDPRRPYPTDIEMRMGFLGRLSDLPINSQMLQQGNLGDIHRSGHQAEPPASQQNQFSWQPSGEMHAAIAGQQIAVMESRNHSKDNEDVEVMSTDSSSSSSSDSQ